MRASSNLAAPVVGCAVAAALLFATGGRSHACSPPPGLSEARVVPTDGLEGVPTNTRIVAVWDGVYASGLCDEQVTVWLRPEAGAAVPLTAARRDEPYRTVVVALPDQPLAPATRYEILVMPLPGGPSFCAPATPEVVATFTTGDAADTTAPVFAGLEAATPYPDICAFGCTCDNDWGRLLADLVWSSAADETPASALRYSIYRTDTAEPLLSLVQWATLAKLCWGWDAEGIGAGIIQTEEGSFYVRAVDLAGNEDDNLQTVDVVFDCSGVVAVPPDAGPPDEPDAAAGAGTDAGTPTEPTPDSGCGCRIRAARGAAGPLWAAVTLLALCARFAFATRCTRRLSR